MNLGFLAAAAVAALTLATHVGVGSPAIVRPLMAAQDIGEASRWMNYYAWHMATVGVAVMAIGFLWAGLRREARPVGLLLTALAALWSALCVYVTIRAGFPFERVFPIWLFAAAALCGVWGVMRGQKVAQV